MPTETLDTGEADEQESAGCEVKGHGKCEHYLRSSDILDRWIIPSPILVVETHGS